jgi:anti-anti-sigma regulatory factor
MLRITREYAWGDRATLRLDGVLGAAWADLLERECSDLRSLGLAVTLDLMGVVFVDRAGVETLLRLGRAGVAIRCRSGAVAGVLEAEGVRLTVVHPWDGNAPGKGGAFDA